MAVVTRELMLGAGDGKREFQTPGHQLWHKSNSRAAVLFLVLAALKQALADESRSAKH